MGSGKGIGIRALVVGVTMLVPASASAHAMVTDPPPRDADEPDEIVRSGHKTGPCGGIARTAKFTQYQPGQTITVKWKETISHQGCFQIAVSEANDQNFTLLKQIDDPAGGAGTNYMDTVTLPNTMCKDCTLVVRQLMQGMPCPNNADPAMAVQGTYYSCADIRIGDFGDAGATLPDGGADDDGGGGSSSGGTTTTPTDGGGKTTDPDEPGAGPGSRNLRAGAGDDGCNVGFGAPGGLSLVASAGFGALALLRRRRKP